MYEYHHSTDTKPLAAPLGTELDVRDEQIGAPDGPGKITTELVADRLPLRLGEDGQLSSQAGGVVIGDPRRWCQSQAATLLRFSPLRGTHCQVQYPSLSR